MPLSFLDIGLAVVMLVSGALATMRGFTREILSIASWAAAAGAALFAYLRFKDWARAEIQPSYLADAVLIAGSFLAVLLIVSIITARISDAILDSRIGALDRTFGFAFGLARGFLIVVIAFLFFTWLVPEQSQPRWVNEARSRELLRSGGAWVMQYMPEDPERALQQLRRHREGEAPADQPPAAAPAQPVQPVQPVPPTPNQRRSDTAPPAQGQPRAPDQRGLDQLIRATQQQPPTR